MMALTELDLSIGERGRHLFRIEPSALKLGHKVIRLDVGWEASPFPGPMLQVDTFEQKQQLQQLCAWLVIDLSESFNQTRPTGPRVEPLRESLPVIPDPIDLLQRSRLESASMRTGMQIHRALGQHVKHFMLGFRRSGALDLSLAAAVSRLLARVQDISLAALIWLTRIKEQRHYLAQHSVNTSILMAGFVHALKWGQERVETAAMVGLLHDLGKSRLDIRLLTKPGALDPAELEEVRAHPVIGFELLQRYADMPWEVCSAIHASHERPDGTGYPRGLSGDAVPVMARLIAIVDAYDAMTSDRVNGRPMTHQQALSVLWKERGRQFDPDLVTAFIQFLGWVPPGTLVRLSDGRLAVALGMQVDGTVRPRVRVIEGRPDNFSFGEELLLPPQFGSVNDSPLRIAELLPDNAQGYAMRELTRQLFSGTAGAQPARRDPEEPGRAGTRAPSAPTGVAPVDRPASTETGPLVGAAVPAGQRSCLVVDDSVTIRVTLENFLGQLGFHVHCLAGGDDVLRTVKSEPPDVIFLDILLPGISGFSVLRELRRASMLQDTAVVMISGNPQATEQYFLERIGADDFLPKPFGRDDVIACIDRLVERGRLRSPAPDVERG